MLCMYLDRFWGGREALACALATRSVPLPLRRREGPDLITVPGPERGEGRLVGVVGGGKVDQAGNSGGTTSIRPSETNLKHQQEQLGDS